MEQLNFIEDRRKKWVKRGFYFVSAKGLALHFMK